MKRMIFIVLAILLFAFNVEARQVSVRVDWFYELAKMPPGMTVGEAYSMTSKIIIYRSDTTSGPWVKLGEFPYTAGAGVVSSVTLTVTFDLADGQLYTVFFAATSVNNLGVESVKSNIVSLPFDLRLAPVPTLRSVSSTVVVP